MNLGNKIVIVGPNGSGKTTFAKKLSQLLIINHIELDNIFWKPDWVESENEEFRNKVNEITAKDKWIVDGNYARNQDLTIGRANNVIWLDYPLYKITYRVIKRSIRRSITKEPLWHNNRESFKKMLMKESIILFAVKSYNRKRKNYISKINNDSYKHINWIIIRTTKEEREFWKDLEK